MTTGNFPHGLPLPGVFYPDGTQVRTGDMAIFDEAEWGGPTKPFVVNVGPDGYRGPGCIGDFASHIHKWLPPKVPLPTGHMFSGLDQAGVVVALRDLPRDNNNQPVVGTVVRTDCPKCGGLMVVRKGPSTRFLGCRAFPTCTGKKWLRYDPVLTCRWRLTTPRRQYEYDPEDYDYDAYASDVLHWCDQW